MKYDASMSWDERTVSALEGAFRSEVRARRVNGPHRDVIVSLDGAEFLVRWLTTGWPRQVAEALHATSRPDILAAPTMSPLVPGRRHMTPVLGGWTSRALPISTTETHQLEPLW